MHLKENNHKKLLMLLIALLITSCQSYDLPPIKTKIIRPRQEIIERPAPLKAPKIEWHLLTEETINKYTDYFFFAIEEKYLIELMDFLIELTGFNKNNKAVIDFYEKQVELNNQIDN